LLYCLADGSGGVDPPAAQLVLEIWIQNIDVIRRIDDPGSHLGGGPLGVLAPQ
jgi:hypothetical protein